MTWPPLGLASTASCCTFRSAKCRCASLGAWVALLANRRLGLPPCLRKGKTASCLRNGEGENTVSKTPIGQKDVASAHMQQTCNKPF